MATYNPMRRFFWAYNNVPRINYCIRFKPVYLRVKNSIWYSVSILKAKHIDLEGGKWIPAAQGASLPVWSGACVRRVDKDRALISIRLKELIAALKRADSISNYGLESVRGRITVIWLFDLKRWEHSLCWCCQSSARCARQCQKLLGRALWSLS